MKNLLKNIGALTFGLSVALVLSPMNAAAAEDGLLVDVNVLNKEDGKSSLLDVEIVDVPIVGDINVNIPSISESEASEALATVEVSGGVVDDLDVSVLKKTESKASVATVELESSLTNDVTVDVISGEETSSTFDGGLVEVNAEDLPLLGETHVGVLDNHVGTDEDDDSATSGSSAVVDVSIDDDEGILDDLGVSVLKREESEAESKASLASVSLETPLTDDLNVDVGLRDETANTFDGGLVEVNAEDLPLLGETHVGVLDNHVGTDEDDSATRGSSAVVDVSTDNDEGILDDLGVSVLKREESEAESKASLASVGLETPLTDDLNVDVGLRDETTNTFDGGLVEVNAEDLPLLGETHAGVLDNHVGTEEDDDSATRGSSAVVDVSTDDDEGILDDLGVSVLKREESEAESKASLASVGLETPLTDDLNVDVGLRDETANTFDGGLVEVNAEDLPLLGETHVGVLDNHLTADEDESLTSGSSAVVDVSTDDDEGILDDLGVSVLKREESEAESKASLASVGLETPLTDDLNVDVGLRDETTNTFDGGLVEVNAEDLPLLGEMHVGVLDNHLTAYEDDSLTRGSSAVVDVSIGDDESIMDNLGVSVLKREESEKKSKSSLASVGLKTLLTNDFNVDVGLRDETANTFDGGLVEVNAENLPLLGETHVGVLDNHLTAGEDGKSLSTGLIQTDLDGGLLEDTSVGVLVRNLRANEDGHWVSESGVSLNLGLPGLDSISADVLKREQFTPVVQTDDPTVVVPPSTDEGNNEGNNDATEENTPNPDVEVDGDLPTVPENTDDTTADGDEENQGTTPPVTTPPVNEGDPGSDVDNQENGTETNDVDAGEENIVNEPEQESTEGNGLSGELNADEGFRTGQLSGIADTTTISGTAKSSIMNGFAMNNADPRSSLPKTGGFWDGKRLAFLALLLVIAGLAMMRMGKSTRLAA